MAKPDRKHAIYVVQFHTDWGWWYWGIGKDRSMTAARAALKEARADFLSWDRKKSKAEARRRFRIVAYFPERSMD